MKIMATIHITESEAARDFPALLAKVRVGAEIVIENGTQPAAMLRSEFPARRTISECIALARRHGQDSGETPSWSQISPKTSPNLFATGDKSDAQPIK